MMKCPMCELQLPDNSTKCTRCKADIAAFNRGEYLFPKKTSPILYVIFAIIIITMIGIIANISSDSSQSPSVDKYDAYAMSHVFVKRNLKAPSTAEFPTTTYANISYDGTYWNVSCFVDAQNSFGAMIRSDYEVKMSYNPKSGNWLLIDIKIENR